MDDPAELATLPAACLVGLDAADAEQVLRALASAALAAGLVGPGFADAVVARERSYPTGLPTTVPVAIPHAEAGHVLHGGFAVATLRRPVGFGVMGTAEDRIDVDVVVMLLIAEAHQQVEVLIRLIGVFQRDGWDAGLRTASGPAELAAAFDALLAD